MMGCCVCKLCEREGRAARSVCRELRARGGRLGLDVSELTLGNEAVALVLFSLALEAHHFALSRGIFHHTVERQLHLAHDIISRNLQRLLLAGPIVASGTSNHCAVRIQFSAQAYLLMTKAAQDGVLLALNGDGYV